MKTIRTIAVFPFELALVVTTVVFVLAEFTCLVLGQLCQLVEGKK